MPIGELLSAQNGRHNITLNGCVGVRLCVGTLTLSTFTRTHTCTLWGIKRDTTVGKTLWLAQLMCSSRR